MTQGDIVAPAPDYESDWLSTLDTYLVRYVILDRDQDSDLLARMRSVPAWFVDFEDGEAALFARRDVIPLSQSASRRPDERGANGPDSLGSRR